MTALSVSTAISSGRVTLVNVRQRSLLTARLRRANEKLVGK